MTIEVREVSKQFGSLKALDKVSFDITPGRLTGFVGGNGAGKTTTMRIILGVLASDGGDVYLDGTPITATNRRDFGYMPEERGLYPKMKVQEQLTYLARLHGLPKAAASRNADLLIERLGLTQRAHDPVEQLSLGNQQRAQVAASLVHEPRFLVLDEPFSGLDPMAVDVVLSVLEDTAARGVPVLLSSHQLDVVERLCDDIVIIAGGQIKASGEKEALRAQHSPPRYRLVASDVSAALHPGVRIVESHADSVVFDCSDAALVQEIARTTVARGALREFTPIKPRLAEIFREVVTDAAKEDAR